jgi:hypothetical protein
MDKSQYSFYCRLRLRLKRNLLSQIDAHEKALEKGAITMRSLGGLRAKIIPLIVAFSSMAKESHYAAPFADAQLAV